MMWARREYFRTIDCIALGWYLRDLLHHGIRLCVMHPSVSRGHRTAFTRSCTHAVGSHDHVSLQLITVLYPSPFTTRDRCRHYFVSTPERDRMVAWREARHSRAELEILA